MWKPILSSEHRCVALDARYWQRFCANWLRIDFFDCEDSNGSRRGAGGPEDMTDLQMAVLSTECCEPGFMTSHELSALRQSSTKRLANYPTTCALTASCIGVVQTETVNAKQRSTRMSQLLYAEWPRLRRQMSLDEMIALLLCHFHLLTYCFANFVSLIAWYVSRRRCQWCG
jgi:hypothetical protein